MGKPWARLPYWRPEAASLPAQPTQTGPGGARAPRGRLGAPTSPRAVAGRKGARTGRSGRMLRRIMQRNERSLAFNTPMHTPSPRTGYASDAS